MRPVPVQTGSATDTPLAGRTSSPGASAVQADHGPDSLRERSSTRPLPLQRAPTRSNANGARTGALPATGRLARRTSAAPATAGAETAGAPR